MMQGKTKPYHFIFLGITVVSESTPQLISMRYLPLPTKAMTNRKKSPSIFVSDGFEPETSWFSAHFI